MVRVDGRTRGGASAGPASARGSASGVYSPSPDSSASHGYCPFPYSTWKGFPPPCLDFPLAIARRKVFLLLGILPDAVPAPAAQARALQGSGLGGTPSQQSLSAHVGLQGGST